MDRAFRHISRTTNDAKTTARLLPSPAAAGSELVELGEGPGVSRARLQGGKVPPISIKGGKVPPICGDGAVFFRKFAGKMGGPSRCFLLAVPDAFCYFAVRCIARDPPRSIRADCVRHSLTYWLHILESAGKCKYSPSPLRGGGSGWGASVSWPATPILTFPHRGGRNSLLPLAAVAFARQLGMRQSPPELTCPKLQASALRPVMLTSKAWPASQFATAWPSRLEE